MTQRGAVGGDRDVIVAHPASIVRGQKTRPSTAAGQLEHLLPSGSWSTPKPCRIGLSAVSLLRGDLFIRPNPTSMHDEPTAEKPALTEAAAARLAARRAREAAALRENLRRRKQVPPPTQEEPPPSP